MNTLSEIHRELSISAALRDAPGTNAIFEEAFRRDVAGWPLERVDQDFLATITRRKLSGRAMMSNRNVHRVAQGALIRSLADAYLQDPIKPWVWCTLTWDAGVSWERMPEIDLVSLKRIVDRHLRRSGLEGVGVIETDVWKNIQEEPGRRVVSHVHFLGKRVPGNHGKVTDLEADMIGRRALANSLGARSVVIRNVKQSVDDFTRLGQYMLKRPAFAKNPVPRDDGEGYRLSKVQHARGSAARLAEIFSHCEVGDVIFSIGSGRAIADKVRDAVRQEISPRAGATPAPSADEVRMHWKRIRETCGSKQFRPCRIVTRVKQPT